VTIYADAAQFEKFQFQLGSPIQRLGTAAVFAPTSDLLAIWNDNQIEIHAFNYPRLGFRFTSPGDTALINTVPLQPIEIHTLGVGVWSPDGRYLAYSDSEGLWLWDVLTPPIPPNLLVPSTAEVIPIPRYFSPMGHFLAVTEGDIRYTLAVRNGMRYPDGVVSPDDRILLAYDTSQKYEIEPVQMWLTPFQSQRIGFEMYEIRQVAWLNESQYLATHYIDQFCTDEITCTPIPRTPILHLGDVGISMAFGRRYFADAKQVIGAYTFDYHRPTKSMLTVASSTSISINGEIHEYGQYLEGDLVHAGWLPSLFYYEDE
jgi:WD40 repeat protein